EIFTLAAAHTRPGARLRAERVRRSLGFGLLGRARDGKRPRPAPCLVHGTLRSSSFAALSRHFLDHASTFLVFLLVPSFRCFESLKRSSVRGRSRRPRAARPLARPRAPSARSP